MNRLLLAPVLVLALSITACGDDGEAAPPVTTAAATVPTTAAPSTTPPTTAAPTTVVTEPEPSTPADSTTSTTAAPTAACPGSGALPDQAENHVVAGGDVDGDGAVDTIHAYSIGDPGVPGAWWVQVSFAAGGGSTVQVLDDNSGLSGVRVFDGFDLDGSGTDEVFARVGAGASVDIIGIFEVIDCELVRVALDGAPFAFATGGSVNFSNGVECVDIDGNGANDFLIVYSGTRMGDSSEFEITAAQYALTEGVLELVLADGLGGDETEPGFDKYRTVDCPGLVLS